MKKREVKYLWWWKLEEVASIEARGARQLAAVGMQPKSREDSERDSELRFSENEIILGVLGNMPCGK